MGRVICVTAVVVNLGASRSPQAHPNLALSLQNPGLVRSQEKRAIIIAGMCMEGGANGRATTTDTGKQSA